MKNEWHVIDAKDKVLGRLATEISGLLLGKHLPSSAKNLVAPVFVVVTNSDEVHLTGKKEDQKIYYRYSGHPGGLRERTAKKQRQLDSTRLIYNAVSGMLPKNNLRDDRLNHLKVYAGQDHPHQAQIDEEK